MPRDVVLRVISSRFGLRSQLSSTAFSPFLSGVPDYIFHFRLFALKKVSYIEAKRKKGKLGTYAMKRVAAGAHLPTPWLFEPAKRPNDRADYCLDCSLLP